MGIGVTSNFMALTDHPLEETPLGQRILSNDKECRWNVFGHQNIEDLRGPARVRAIVEGERDEAWAITRASDRIGSWHPHEIDVRKQAVRAQGQATFARRWKRRDTQNFAMPSNVDIGALGEMDETRWASRGTDSFSENRP